ncbi:MAG: hypothetical protein OEU92_31410 [Alphaproteobacteria bacterium]|nr:hypothetical protein [Alphaproteobacteria bacterium]
MAAPLADFSSLLEISFALNVLSGFARTNLHEKIERYEERFSDVVSEYKEEQDQEIDRDLHSSIEKFLGKLPIISDLITLLIIICAAISVFLLVISSLDSSLALGNLSTTILVLTLVAFPIVATFTFNFIVRIRYMLAIDRLARIMHGGLAGVAQPIEMT